MFSLVLTLQPHIFLLLRILTFLFNFSTKKGSDLGGLSSKSTFDLRALKQGHNYKLRIKGVHNETTCFFFLQQVIFRAQKPPQLALHIKFCQVVAQHADVFCLPSKCASRRPHHAWKIIFIKRTKLLEMTLLKSYYFSC